MGGSKALEALQSLQASTSAARAHSASRRAMARVNGLPTALIQVPGADGGTTSYQAMGDYAGKFSGRGTHGPFDVVKLDGTKFMMSYGPVNWQFPVNATEEMDASSNPTFVWLKLSFAPDGEFLESRWGHGGELPQPIVGQFANLGYASLIHVPAAVVFPNDKGSGIADYHLCLGAPIMVHPVVASIENPLVHYKMLAARL